MALIYVYEINYHISYMLSIPTGYNTWIFDNVLLTLQLINYLYGDFLFELYIGSH